MSKRLVVRPHSTLSCTRAAAISSSRTCLLLDVNARQTLHSIPYLAIAQPHIAVSAALNILYLDKTNLLFDPIILFLYKWTQKIMEPYYCSSRFVSYIFEC